MDYPKYEFYVINENFNAKEIVMYNIFNNWLVSEDVFKYCKKHLRNKKKYTFEQLQEDIRRTIQWQEWSRCEYEVQVGSLFIEDYEKELKKIDCYWQAEPNMKLITEMCVKRTKEFLKEKKQNVGVRNS